MSTMQLSESDLRQWLDEQMAQINGPDHPLYIKLADNQHVKKHMDEVLEFRKLFDGDMSITWTKAELFEYVERKHHKNQK